MIAGEQYHYITVFQNTGRKLLIGDPSRDKNYWIDVSSFNKIWVPVIIADFILVDKNKLGKFCNKQPHLIKHTILTCMPLMIGSLFLSLIAYALSVYLSTMFSAFIDKLIPNKYVSAISIFASIYSVTIVVQVIVNILNSTIAAKINNKVDQKLSKALVYSFFSKSIQYVESFSSGEIITRFTHISDIRSRILFFAQMIPLEGILITVTTVILAKFNIYLTMITYIPVLLFTLIYVITQDGYTIRSYKIYQEGERLNSNILEGIQNVNTINSFSYGTKFQNKTFKTLQQYNTLKEHLQIFDSIITQFKSGLLSLFSLSVLAIGSYLVISDDLSIGTILIFNTLTNNVLNPFTNLMALQSALQQGRVAQEKFLDIVSSQFRNTKNLQVDSKKALLQSIQIDHVSFSYDKSITVLNDVNLNINIGDKILLTGQNGSGKSTLGKLIAGIYSPVQGEIRVVDVNDHALLAESQPNKILYVPSIPEIFNDTLYENIVLGNDTITREQIYHLAQSIGFKSTIESFPEQLSTTLEQNGSSLSTGQKQLVSILRVLVHSKPIIILDEVTNGLDKTHKISVMKEISKHCATVIIISHDHTLEAFVDRSIDISSIQEGSL